MVGSDDFQFIRIAHLSAMAVHKGSELTEEEKSGADEEKSWHIGPFSAVPMQQKGCRANFRHFRVADKEEGTHSSDVSAMVDK